tara:strand:- start:15186 stop:15386 length:201 start_codon:yes stop_codon:yes gene_type:complete
MNIEQNSNMQELTEEEYTKVYAGMMSYELFPENNVMTIQPFNPSKPKKNTFTQSSLNPNLSTTFGK